MRFIAVLALLTLAMGTARARADVPEQPPAPLAPLAPEAAPAPPAPGGPMTPAPDAPAASAGCGSWPLALVGGALEGGSLAVGGLLFCVGGLMATTVPTSGSDNCAQACVDFLVALAVVALGMVIAGAGLVVLGPIAAVAVTIGTALAASGAQRAVWPAIVGGSIGVVASALGIGLLVWGVTNTQALPFVAGGDLHLADTPHLAIVSGISLAAMSGLISLGSALALDVAFGSPAAPQEEAGTVARAPPVWPALPAEQAVAY